MEVVPELIGKSPQRPVVCVQEGAGFVADESLAENFHVITQHHYAVLLNKDTFKRDDTWTPFTGCLQAQVLHVGRRGHGCYLQVPQSP